MKIKTLLIFILTALLIAVLIGCTQPPEETSDTTGETTESTTAEVTTIREPKYRFWIFDDEKKEIEDAWYKRNGTELYWNEFMGTTSYGFFNDCVVLITISEGACEKYVIEDVTFSYPVLDSFWLHVYKDGKFYHLDEAYKNGLLSYEDILLVHESHEKYTKSHPWMSIN